MLQSDSAAICVVGAVIRDNMVLLVHRSPSARFWPDVWDLFGGHVNEGESLEEALQREAREELGIDALALKWLGRMIQSSRRWCTCMRSHRGRENQ